MDQRDWIIESGLIDNQSIRTPTVITTHYALTHTTIQFKVLIINEFKWKKYIFTTIKKLNQLCTGINAYLWDILSDEVMTNKWSKNDAIFHYKSTGPKTRWTHEYRKCPCHKRTCAGRPRDRAQTPSLYLYSLWGDPRIMALLRHPGGFHYFAAP